jgi:hypothetical protein
MPSAPRYMCPCSGCYQKPKNPVTKRTLENHLSRDQGFMQSIPPNSDHTSGRDYVESCIQRTIELLSQINTGYLLPDTAPDADRSYLGGSEGAPLSLSVIALYL